jgi:hypothetical protein
MTNKIKSALTTMGDADNRPKISISSDLQDKFVWKRRYRKDETKGEGLFLLLKFFRERKSTFFCPLFDRNHTTKKKKNII